MCGCVAPATAARAGRRSSAGVHVRRVRYASAAGETLAYTGAMQARAAGALGNGAPWPASGAHSGRRPGASWTPAPTSSTRTGGCPRGLAAPSGAPHRPHLPRDGRRACCAIPASHERLARPVFRRAQGGDRGLPRAGGWIQNGVGRFVSPDHVHPMPVDSERPALDHRRRWGRGRRRLTPQKRVSPRDRRAGRSWRPADTTSRSPS